MIFTGCGVPFHKKLDMYLQAEQYEEADEMIAAEKKSSKENIYSGKNGLLYYLDRAGVLQALGDYDNSTMLLEKADEKIDALYTKSVLDETAALLSDENAIEYRGEDFERVTVSILKMLNFMYAGNFNGARVESKKVDQKLRVFTDEYGEKCIYNEDAFARYLAGFAYEALGEMDNAYIDYKKSLETYQKYMNVYGTKIPAFVKPALLRAADYLKYTDEMAEFARDWGEIPEFTKYRDLRDKGEVLIVIHNGLPPVKYDSNTYPKYQSRGPALEKAVARVDGKEFQSETGQDIDVIAAKNLDNRIGLIIAKKAASSVAKGLLKAFTGIDMGSGKADTRSWRTIPSRFDIIRMEVTPGKKKINVDLYTVSGLARQVVLEADVKAGAKKVMPVFAFSGIVMPKFVEKK